MSDLNFYQTASRDYAKYDVWGDFEYPALGLTGEAGEVANKIKKLRRDGVEWTDIREDMISELGDVLWYLARIADAFRFSLADVADANLLKLEDRNSRGVIHGSGDNR